jgi:thiol-disulfide isomerase/thioredoxin
MLSDAKGASIKLSDYKGRVVLLNFWATWCGPCKIEIPWFVEFQNKYKDRGLAVLGVSMDEEGWQTVRPFIAAHNMNYRVAIGTDQVARRYGGIGSLPTIFVKKLRQMEGTDDWQRCLFHAVDQGRSGSTWFLPTIAPMSAPRFRPEEFFRHTEPPCRSKGAC